jgi:GntR family transcriptional regulator
VTPDSRKGPSGRPRRTSEVNLDACPEIDRESEIPFYYQLAASLFEALEVKRPAAGEPFPTERELMERFSVSRTVVRDALKLLVADGAIDRVKGLGSFVAPKRRALRPQGVIAILAENAERISLQFLDVTTQVPRPAVSRLLGLKRGTKVASAMSVVCCEGEPLGLIESNFAPVLSSFVLSAAEQADGSRASKQKGVRLTRTAVRIEQTCMGPWGAPKFGASPGDPALMAHLIQFGRTAAGKDECPLEYGHLICPSRSVQLVAELP